MAHDLTKRLTALKRGAERSGQGLVGFWRVFFASLAGFALLVFLIRMISPAAPAPGVAAPDHLGSVSSRLTGSDAEEALTLSWRSTTEREIHDRVSWLSSTPFGFLTADSYVGFSKSMIRSFYSEDDDVESEDVFDVRSWVTMIKRGIASTLLRLGFLVIGFWPLWIIASVVGYFAARYFLQPQPTDDMLGICDPQNGPFYSGIWGKFKPNKSLSGTDYACPGLACPDMAKRPAAMSHELCARLKQFHAFNDTNLSLLRIILAYKNFPSKVDEEHSAEDDIDLEAGEEVGQPVPTGIISNDGLTLEESAIMGLRAVVEAHHGLIRYRELVQQKQDLKTASDRFRFHSSVMKQLIPQVTPLAALLLQSLTPDRALALSEFPVTALTSAYLAIEAGKSLVYERLDEHNFTQISRFPNLQARAVMQAIPCYIKEYDGDTRLQIRQAIVSSRRHGDFGRTFLPVTMSIASRALRDWLEILYAVPDVREVTANLVELDAHIAEVHVYWRGQVARHIKGELGEGSSRSESPNFSLGIPYKSVLLMPLRTAARIGLSAISNERQDRIVALIEMTRKRQERLSTSAGLPGFKRQAVEASQGGFSSGGITKLLAEGKDDQQLVTEWVVIRRMLTHYNWLSTRVGDDGVPADGLLQAVLVSRPTDGGSQKAEVIGLDAVVPLRQRRFQQILGDSWDRDYFHGSPNQRDVEIVTDHEEFENTVKRWTREVQNGGGGNTPSAISA